MLLGVEMEGSTGNDNNWSLGYDLGVVSVEFGILGFFLDQ